MFYLTCIWKIAWSEDAALKEICVLVGVLTQFLVMGGGRSRKRTIKACDPFCKDLDRVAEYKEFGGAHRRSKFARRSRPDASDAPDAIDDSGSSKAFLRFQKKFLLPHQRNSKTLHTNTVKGRTTTKKSSAGTSYEKEGSIASRSSFSSAMEYIQHVDRNTKLNVESKLKEMKTVSDKKKRFYKRKATSKIVRRKLKALEELDSQVTESIPFGEVNHRPPSLSAVKR